METCATFWILEGLSLGLDLAWSSRTYHLYLILCFEEKPFNIFDCSSKMLYNVIAGKSNGCYKVHEKRKSDFLLDNLNSPQWQQLYRAAFISSIGRQSYNVFNLK